MNYIMENFTMLISILLGISEAIAAISQLIFPKNQGVSGVIAFFVKLLQKLGAKDQV